MSKTVLGGGAFEETKTTDDGAIPSGVIDSLQLSGSLLLYTPGDGGLAGLTLRTFTTAARDALPPSGRPPGSIILNVDTGRLESYSAVDGWAEYATITGPGSTAVQTISGTAPIQTSRTGNFVNVAISSTPTFANLTVADTGSSNWSKLQLTSDNSTNSNFLEVTNSDVSAHRLCFGRDGVGLDNYSAGRPTIHCPGEDIYINTGAATNRVIASGGIDTSEFVRVFNNAATGGPTVGGSVPSTGTKLLLAPIRSDGSHGDYAMGVDTTSPGKMWFQAPSTAEMFRWWLGSTNVMQLTNTALTINGNTVTTGGPYQAQDATLTGLSGGTPTLTNKVLTVSRTDGLHQGLLLQQASSAQSMFLEITNTDQPSHRFIIGRDGTGLVGAVNGRPTIYTNGEDLFIMTSTANRMICNGGIDSGTYFRQTDISSVAGPTVGPNPPPASTKIIYYPGARGTGGGDMSTGVEAASLWHQVRDTSDEYHWYAGLTRWMTLNNAGLTIAGAITATSINTASTGEVDAGTFFKNTNTSNFGAPTVGGSTPSVGTKVLIYPGNRAGGLGDMAIGVEGGATWHQVNTTDEYRWYGGTTRWMTLNSSGLTANATDGSPIASQNFVYSQINGFIFTGMLNQISQANSLSSACWQSGSLGTEGILYSAPSRSSMSQTLCFDFTVTILAGSASDGTLTLYWRPNGSALSTATALGSKPVSFTVGNSELHLNVRSTGVGSFIGAISILITFDIVGATGGSWDRPSDCYARLVVTQYHGNVPG